MFFPLSLSLFIFIVLLFQMPSGTVGFGFENPGASCNSSWLTQNYSDPCGYPFPNTKTLICSWDVTLLWLLTTPVEQLIYPIFDPDHPHFEIFNPESSKSSDIRTQSISAVSVSRIISSDIRSPDHQPGFPFFPDHSVPGYPFSPNQLHRTFPVSMFPDHLLVYPILHIPQIVFPGSPYFPAIFFLSPSTFLGSP